MYSLGAQFGGVAGAVVGGAVGAALGTYLSDKVSAKVDEVGNTIEKNVDVAYDYICPQCGKQWSRKYRGGQLIQTDAFINRKKDEYIQTIKPNVLQSVISFIISGAICGGSLYYCITNDSMIYGSTTLLGFEMQTSNPNWTWWFLGFVALVFILITLYNIGAIGREIEKGEIIKKVEKMSPQDFLESEYWGKVNS